MFYVCNKFHINKELAEKISSKFADTSVNDSSVKIESSEEIRSHKECNITITGLVHSTTIGSIYFLEFYSAANLIEKLWIETKDLNNYKEIKEFIEIESNKKLKFDKYLTRDDSNLF
jgi:hypothetical protein